MNEYHVPCQRAIVRGANHCGPMGCNVTHSVQSFPVHWERNGGTTALTSELHVVARKQDI